VKGLMNVTDQMNQISGEECSFGCSLFDIVLEDRPCLDACPDRRKSSLSIINGRDGGVGDIRPK
jgi:hypothetical protein